MEHPERRVERLMERRHDRRKHPSTPNAALTSDPAVEELKRIRELEDAVVKKLEEKEKLKKLEEQARSEITREFMRNAKTDGPSPASVERKFLMAGAALIILIIPFLYTLSSIFLAAFALVVAIAAGLTSTTRSYTPTFNLFVSALGTLIFQYDALYRFNVDGHATFVFWMLELTAIVFLFATYFSVKIYRQEL